MVQHQIVEKTTKGMIERGQGGERSGWLNYMFLEATALYKDHTRVAAIRNVKSRSDDVYYYLCRMAKVIGGGV